MESSGTKTITIEATTRYPVVSAYEYEFLKQEAVVRERLTKSTIYVIMQRPFTYFQNVRSGLGEVSFDIVDDQNEPLRCVLHVTESGIGDPGEELSLKIHYFKNQPDLEPPFNDVAALQFYRADGSFAVWYSPQKFLYEVLVGGLVAEIDGDPASYLDFHVHYIGQAFSQRVWNRLTGHEKMQRILTLEGPRGAKAQPAPFEISLLTLEVIGFTEAVAFPTFEGAVPEGVEPILHTFTFEDDDDRFENFYVPSLTPTAPELTNEVEAMLIRLFRPEYNDVKFENYPHIKKGTRSAGYSHSSLMLEGAPVLLRTEAAQMEVGDGSKVEAPADAG